MLIYQPRKHDIYPTLQTSIQTLGGRCGLGRERRRRHFPCCFNRGDKLWRMLTSIRETSHSPAPFFSPPQELHLWLRAVFQRQCHLGYPAKADLSRIRPKVVSVLPWQWSQILVSGKMNLSLEWTTPLTGITEVWVSSAWSLPHALASPMPWHHPPVSCLTLLPSTNIQEHLCTESFPLPLPAYSRAKHGNSYLLVAIINRLFWSNTKKKGFSWADCSKCNLFPITSPKSPHSFLTHLYKTHKMKTPKTQ